MEGRQRGHPHPIDAQSMSVNAYERYAIQIEN
jgi:hypothetical protein